MLGDLPPLFFIALVGSALCGGLAAWMVWRWLSRAGVWRRLAGAFADEEASAIVEFPFALTVLLLFTLLMWEFGHIAASFHVVDWAAFSTARAASVIIPDDQGTLDRVDRDDSANKAWDEEGNLLRLDEAFYGPVDAGASDGLSQQRRRSRYPGLEDWAGPRTESWVGEMPNVIQGQAYPERHPAAGGAQGDSGPGLGGGGGPGAGPPAEYVPPSAKGTELWEVAAFACTPLALPFRSEAERAVAFEPIRSTPPIGLVERMMESQREALFGWGKGICMFLLPVNESLADLPSGPWERRFQAALARTRVRLQPHLPSRALPAVDLVARRESAFRYTGLDTAVHLPRDITIRVQSRGLVVPGGTLITVEVVHDYRLRLPFARTLFRLLGGERHEDGNDYLPLTARCSMLNEGYPEQRPGATPPVVTAPPYRRPGSAYYAYYLLWQMPPQEDEVVRPVNLPLPMPATGPGGP